MPNRGRKQRQAETVSRVDGCGGADCGRQPTRALEGHPSLFAFSVDTAVPKREEACRQWPYSSHPIPSSHCVDTTHEHDHHQIVHFHLHLSISWRGTTTFAFDNGGSAFTIRVRFRCHWVARSVIDEGIGDTPSFPALGKCSRSATLSVGRAAEPLFIYFLPGVTHLSHISQPSKLCVPRKGHLSLCTQTKSRLRCRCSLDHPLRLLSPPARLFRIRRRSFTTI